MNISYNSVLEYKVEFVFDNDSLNLAIAVDASENEDGIEGTHIMRLILEIFESPSGVFVYFDRDRNAGTLVRASNINKIHFSKDSKYEGVLVLPGLTEFF